MSTLALHRELKDPLVEASDQIIEAVNHVEQHPSTLMGWPWETLDELTGPMSGGEVWFVGAFSGGGKTSFIASAVEHWCEAGKRVFVMPLELQPYRFRTYMACMELGMFPGDALSHKLRRDESRAWERKELVKTLNAQIHRENLRVDSVRDVTLAKLQGALKRAFAFKADVVIIDHIDHIDGELAGNLYAASVSVNKALLRMAQDNGLLVIATTQLNMEILKGRDHLAKYGPPMQHHLRFPTAKIDNATGIIGLFRPTRPQKQLEGAKEFAAAMDAARKGETDAGTMLEQGVVGVTAMKLRNYGQHEGRKIKLGFERGRVVDLRPVDRYEDPR